MMYRRLTDGLPTAYRRLTDGLPVVYRRRTHGLPDETTTYQRFTDKRRITEGIMAAPTAYRKFTGRLLTSCRRIADGISVCLSIIYQRLTDDFLTTS